MVTMILERKLGVQNTIIFIAKTSPDTNSGIKSFKIQNYIKIYKKGSLKHHIHSLQPCLKHTKHSKFSHPKKLRKLYCL